MKKTWRRIVIATALMGTLVYPLTPAHAQESPATPPPTQPVPGSERHPEIRRALVALEKARFRMKHAAHDFGGHRVEALVACDKAIEQLRLALQYDKD
jgi:hypothetical protein